MDNVFLSLTSGTKFNKRKHGEAMKIFSEKSSKKVDLLQSIIPQETENKSSERTSDRNVTIEGDSNSSNSHSHGSGEVVSSTFQREEELNAFRNKLNIQVKGNNIPHPITNFEGMALCKQIKHVIMNNIEASEWKEPTAVQMQAIPAFIAGRDLLVAAPTGSGKTAAFVIPILSILSSEPRTLQSGSVNVVSTQSKGVRALILAPTKELAEQIQREATRLSAGKRLKISSLSKKLASAATRHQDKSAFANIDLLITTPMRLLGILRADAIDLSSVQVVVLDEADKLFELNQTDNKDNDNEDPVLPIKKVSKKKNNTGSSAVETSGHETIENEEKEADIEVLQEISSSFLAQVDEILSKCSKGKLQRALFSATIGPFVQNLASTFLHDAVHITIGVANAGASSIDQRLVFVGREDGKLLAMRQLIQQGLKPPVLIFLQSKERAKELFLELVYDGINVDVIHAERTLQQREEVIRRFRVGEIWVLICTDLMARGVDFKGVQMVINYDLPQTAVAYIHRIGRTGRAGQKGTAVTFFTESDLPKIRPIANVMRLSGCTVPSWMLSIKKMSTKEKRKLRVSAPLRRHISTTRPEGKALKETTTSRSGLDK